MSKLSNSNNFSSNYNLEYEKIIKTRTSIQNKKAASVIEKKELEYIASHIIHEQNWILSQEDRFIYPNVFNPKYVSDVISLNFDHIAEEKTKKYFNYSKIVDWENQSSFSNEKKKAIYNYTSFREIIINKDDKIRFWYPHGSYLKYENIVLGINKYSSLTEYIIRIRKHYKAHERKKITDLTWFSQIVENPVIILGASISEAEWALWSAIVYAKRNFAKNDSYKKPIFKMMSPEESSNLNDDWILPLYKDMEFTAQWEELEKLLNR